MTPLQTFARSLLKARSAFDASTRRASEWLVFYEAKQTAYAALIAACPHITTIEDIWRYFQNMPVSRWLPVLEAEAKRVKHTECQFCGVGLIWPNKICDSCRRARRLEAIRAAKERAFARSEEKKCPVCGVERLPFRGKVCKPCQRKRGAERNKTYRKSLKDRKRDGFGCDFTRETTETFSPNGIKTLALQNVATEPVTLS